MLPGELKWQMNEQVNDQEAMSAKDIFCTYNVNLYIDVNYSFQLCREFKMIYTIYTETNVEKIANCHCV